MDFYVVNKSAEPRLTVDKLEAACLAVDLQVLNDFGPTWGLNGSVSYVDDESLVPPGGDSAIVRLVDDAAPGELGDHDEQNDAVEARLVVPEIMLNVGDAILSGATTTLSTVLSHEILETLLDRYANLWVQRADGSLTALEACDAVQDGSYPVHLESLGLDVMVSNFITRAWTDSEAPIVSEGAGGYDFLGLLSAPLSRTPGGYLIVMSGGDVTEEYGEKIEKWRMERARLRAAKRKLRAAK
jgi:hypothetical protein